MTIFSYLNAIFKSLYRFLPKFSSFKSTNPMNPLKVKELGNEAYKNRHYALAHQHYDRGIELEPNNIILLLNKAAVFLEENKFDDCIQICMKAVEIGSDNNSDRKYIAKAFTRIGNAYLKQQNLPEALQYFEKSIFEYYDDRLVQKYEELKKTLEEMKDETRIDTEITSKENAIQIDRHCAFCLKFLPSGTSKLCGKCHRRAYCSRQCQLADWEQCTGSQGHKNWCHLECGEEDIDWEVKQVRGKGLGVIAKRQIPARYRIMVDAVRNFDHPAIDDLMPIGGTTEEKIALNTLRSSENQKLLCLRISRLNHDCFPNATTHYDRSLDVDIVFVEREIQAGEEITMTYLPMTDIIWEINLPSFERTINLQKTWGIFCKEDCFCKKKLILDAIEKCVLLRRELRKYVNEKNGKEAIKTISSFFTR